MKFEIVDEKQRYNARIKVIGVGGAGGNAINNMISTRLRGVDFIVANTDCQDLDRSACSYKIQLGPSITRGLGTGADPEIGKQSAEESINEIRETVDGTDMVFIAAGMGGGTGTGAAPVVARECKEGGALTVAVVTKPFSFEGNRRMERAIEGIERLKGEVDSLIILPNERLKSLGDTGSSFRELISRADDVLLQAVRGISDLIVSNGFINLDFADVKKVMGQMGTAIMGMGKARGEDKAIEAAQEAINSPLLEDISISGAKGLLINITGSPDMTMEEINQASNYIKEEVSPEAEIFFGVVFEESVEDEIQVTVIATGIEGDNAYRARSREIVRDPHSNVVKLRDVEPEDVENEWSVKMNGEILDVPAYSRNESFNREKVPTRAKGKRGFFRKLGIGDNLDYPTFLRAKAD
ncbi:MAG: cell division protein FtsZ [Desulfatiglans sp.]|nr:cell division protein FtsZ [Thermodesulfobacteriota bacterium]MEE4351289.1 cell division protein FtsZ [Desulfatiglans sp.]